MSASKRNHGSFSETVLFMLSLTVPHLEPASSSAAISPVKILWLRMKLFFLLLCQSIRILIIPRGLMGIEECANDVFYKFLIHIECE